MANANARLVALERRMDGWEARFDATAAALSGQITLLRDEMRAANSAIRTDLGAEIRTADESIRADLRAEIRAGNDESRRYMRVLFEELVDRIGRIGEGA